MNFSADNRKEGRELSRRHFIKNVGCIGGTAPCLACIRPAGKKKEIEKEKARVAVIGTGSLGQYHLHNLREIPHAEVVTLCDDYGLSLRAAQVLCPHAKCYSDYRKLLDDPHIDGHHCDTAQLACVHDTQCLAG